MSSRIGIPTKFHRYIYVGGITLIKIQKRRNKMGLIEAVSLRENYKIGMFYARTGIIGEMTIGRPILPLRDGPAQRAWDVTKALAYTPVISVMRTAGLIHWITEDFDVQNNIMARGEKCARQSILFDRVRSLGVKGPIITGSLDKDYMVTGGADQNIWHGIKFPKSTNPIPQIDISKYQMPQKYSPFNCGVLSNADIESGFIITQTGEDKSGLGNKASFWNNLSQNSFVNWILHILGKN